MTRLPASFMTNNCSERIKHVLMPVVLLDLQMPLARFPFRIGAMGGEPPRLVAAWQNDLA